MKFQKLDSKQVPQVVVLGVLCVGVVGYGAYSVLGSVPEEPKRKAEAKSSGASQAQLAQAPAGETGATSEAVSMAEAPQAVPGLQLPGQYNPDPFKPARQLTPPKKVSKAPTVSVRPSRPERSSAPQRDFRLTPLPFPGAGATFQPPAAPARPVPVVPPAPVRPQVAMLGVIDVDEGDDMALLELQGQQQMVQVGQLVADYRIKEIHLDRVVLVHGKDRFVVYLAAPSSEKSAPARSSEIA
ncbi:MAG: hypothetical protein ACK47B_03030 [Armatimonadota bacterium]